MKRPIVQLASAVSAGILVGAMLVPLSGASVAAEDALLPTVAPAVSESVRIRTELGLRADTSYVSRTLSDSTGFPRREFNGIPLSQDEARELERRIAIQQSIGPAREWASRQTGSAGGYTDQLAGGVPVFAFTGDPSLIEPGLVAQMPKGTPFRIERVSRSMSDLLSLKAQVRGQWDSLERADIDILDVGIDTMANVVSIGVIGLTRDEELTLRGLFPDGVVVTGQQPARLDSCTSRTDCGDPIKGGLTITPSGLSGYCTSAYIGELNNSSPATLRVVTAGHCIELKGGIGKAWKHNGVTFGTATVETWAVGADGDVGVITLANGGLDANLVYASANWDIRHFTSYAFLSEVHVNDFFCRSGATTNYLCGRVVALDQSLDVNGKLIDHQNKVDYDASPGDSGGPYWFANKFYGIHSDSTDDGAPGTHYAWYTPYVWAATVVSNVDICLDNDC